MKSVDEANPSKAAMELWEAACEDSFKEAKVDLRKTDWVKLKQWLLGPQDGDGDVTAKATPEAPPSAAELRDLAAQGMTKPRELRHLELGSFVGYVAPEAELVGGAYRGRPNSYAGARLAIKQGALTIDAVLDKADVSGSAAGLDSHFTTLATDFGNSDDPALSRLSTVLLQWWSATQRNLLHRDDAIIMYVREYRRFWHGRGFPKEYDETIGQRALMSKMMANGGGTGEAKPIAQRAMGAKSILSLSDTHSEASTSSTIPSSASAYQDSQLKAISEVRAQQEAQAEQMKEFMSAMNTMRSVLGDVSARLKRMPNENENADKFMKCLNCNEKGHRAANCTKPGGGKAEKAEE